MAAEKLKNNSVFKPRNHRESFLLYLFNDPDFIKEIEKVKSSLKSLMGDDAYGVLMLLAGTKDLVEHLQEFKEYDSSAIIRNIKDLARHFDVTEATIFLGIRYSRKTPNLIFKSMPLAAIEDGGILLRLNANTRLDDIKAMFWYIEELQQKLPNHRKRNRLKEQPELIYAIYKQRLQNKKWREIYSLYEQGRLPGYDGSREITGEENLADMYRKYKPAI